MAAQETPASTRAAVDVLAVMGDVGQVLCDFGCVATARKIEDSCAAVAELIKALELSDAWIREVSLQTGLRATATLAQNHAALARVKGGAQ